MCGIFGVVIKDKNKYSPENFKKIVRVLFKLSESRGKEAAGIAVKRKDSIDVLKSPLSASKFLKSSSYKKFADKLSNCTAVVGHSRLATHGTEYKNINNQPIIKDSLVCVHNGIIANDKELWQKFSDIKKESDLDTEVFLALLQLFLKEFDSISMAIQKVFERIEGSASIAVMFNNRDSLLLATNTGSLYTCENDSKDVFVFASERYILEEFAEKVKKIDSFKKDNIKQLKPGSAVIVDLKMLSKNKFTFSEKDEKEKISFEISSEVKIVDHSDIQYTDLLAGINLQNKDFKISPETRKEMTEVWENIYSGEGLKRCKKCLLPESMVFIEFDNNRVCNYCRNYKKRKTEGREILERIALRHKRNDGRHDCLAPFSGGRDSTYGLHYLKNVLKMNPIAFTYDWGMLTDLGRRNAARVCGKLGIEHIIVSADIRKKRENIRKNIEAWLKKPEMGIIPLFMAGDKELEKQIEWAMGRTGVNVSIASGARGLEEDFMKIGCTGIRTPSGQSYYSISLTQKLKLAKYYFFQYLRNPAYINTSVFDTVFGAYCAFIYNHPTLHLFDYIEWNEEKILSTIINEYGWEREKNTSVTWRIDDGTASFYNYIYFTVLGLSENDVLRSKLIGEGQNDREKAFALAKEENKPRFDSLEWYARTIGFDINKAIKKINEIPRLYHTKK